MDSENTVQQLAIRLGNRLREQRLLITTAESCTGGMVASAITDISGSSGWFERGFVTSSNQAKSEMIGVPADMIEKHGAVSESIAREMAEGALRNSRAQLSLSITGIAGPGGGTPQKPVGTVCFAWSNRVHTLCQTRVFKGDRRQIRLQASAHALRGVLTMLEENENEN